MADTSEQNLTYARDFITNTTESIISTKWRCRVGGRPIPIPACTHLPAIVCRRSDGSATRSNSTNRPTQIRTVQPAQWSHESVNFLLGGIGHWRCRGQRGPVFLFWLARGGVRIACQLRQLRIGTVLQALS